jgi:hypothetical protein
MVSIRKTYFNVEKPGKYVALGTPSRKQEYFTNSSKEQDGGTMHWNH